LTRDEKIEQIEWLVNFKKESDRINDKVYELFGAGDNIVVDQTWVLFDKHLDLVSEKLGDDDNTLSWFIFDNDMGKQGLILLTKNNSPVDIDSIEKLVDFISLEK
jgi:hypothetical protein